MQSYLATWKGFSQRGLLLSPFVIPRRILQCIKLGCYWGDFHKLRETILNGYQKQLLVDNPVILYKFLGCYLATCFSTKDRLDILLNHYSYMNRFLMSEKLCAALPGKIILWHNTVENIGYSVALTVPDLTFFEGELVIEFIMDNQVLYRLSFAIVPGNLVGLSSVQTLLIGGSQGTANTAIQARQAAKANNEISPAATLIIALKALGKVMNISTITGVSSRCQCTDTININPSEHYSTYDSLWEASGGIMSGDFFTFPIKIYEKNIELVPRHHRTRTRKKRQQKQALFDNLHSNLQIIFADQ